MKAYTMFTDIGRPLKDEYSVVGLGIINRDSCDASIAAQQDCARARQCNCTCNVLNSYDSRQYPVNAGMGWATPLPDQDEDKEMAKRTVTSDVPYKV